MLKRVFCVSVCILAVCGIALAQTDKRADDAPKHLKFRSVPFTEVKFEDGFWKPRIDTNTEISIPHNYKWCEDTGRFTNFTKAAKLKDGKFQGIYFNDSDVYKLLEGTAYSLAAKPDAKLEKQADDVIAWIGAAQQPDGYLNTYFTLQEPEKRWTNTHNMHELYCAGHLIEAAVAYKRATGKDSLLAIAEKFVDHISNTFGPEAGKKVEVPGHEEIELALVKLYQLTGKEKYLKLSKFFIDMRGMQNLRTDKLQGAYSQDHMPVKEQKEIFGHAVRAMYLFAGVADNAAYSGDPALIDAMDTLWNDVVNKKMYITGGIGARHEGEAFGNAFELPNGTAYCETCAAIGLVFWAHRLNLMHGDAKYADVVERAMYNGVLSGIGRDGKGFFYVNPLASGGGHHRQPFFDCACCPTNVVRFVPSLPGYQYASDTEGIIVNQFIAGKASVLLPDGEIEITQETDYPWNGDVKITFVPKKKKESAAKQFKVKYRKPGESQYATETADWNLPHTLDIKSVLSPYRILANPQVEADRGRVAIQRGPLVYCFEQCDNEVPVNRILLARDPEFKYEFKSDLLGGMGVITCKNADGKTLTAVPYFAWDHREPGRMEVWVRQQGLSKKPADGEKGWTNETTKEPILYRTLEKSMLKSDAEIEDEAEPEATASNTWGNDTADAIIDGKEPKSSADATIPRHTFWPRKGTAEWIEIDFGKPRDISKVSLYWFDDTGTGECRIPKSWKLFLRDGEKWVEAKTSDSYGVAKDAYNPVGFEKTKTQAIRVEVQLQPDVSGGTLECKVE